MPRSQRTYHRPPKQLSCYTCQRRHESEWSVLTGEDLALLERARTTIAYGPGQMVFAQGNPCRGVHCVESGTVALRKTDAAGNSILVRLAHSGQTLGYRDFFGGGGYGCTAEALVPSTICEIESGALQQLLLQNPALGLRFLEHLSHDLDAAEDSILQNVSLSVRTRLAHLLLTLKDRYGVSEGETLVLSLPMTRQDMAALLGTRPETIARTISAMESDAVVSFSGRQVTIPSLENLLNEIEPN